METISRSLLTFLLNSLWQVTLSAAAAALIFRLLRKGPAAHSHAIWVAALAASLLLPLASIRTAASGPTPHFTVELTAPVVAAVRYRPLPPQAPMPPAPETAGFTHTTVRLLALAYLLFFLFRLGRLAWRCVRTVQIRRGADAGAIPEILESARSRCQRAFGLTGVSLRISTRISGPATAGRAILLPESLRSESSEDVLLAAIGHEMAHIARRDFASNLVYELFYLPVSFHPAAWLIRRGIERTREMACDELVTRRLIDGRTYAQSIVSIAKTMIDLPRPGYTLGVFDGKILEERVRRLTEHTAATFKRPRLLLAGGLSALALTALVASTIALTARAQSAADGLLQQGKAALQQGDNRTAANFFATAVQIEPANLNAKLLLAGALMGELLPGGSPADSASPLVAAAQQQYADVLARDSHNRQAIDGMLLLYTHTTQWDQAHAWAVRAIQANATDEVAYYTAGFLDWVRSYPIYSKARQAAGMRPEDPGIIPDTGLRQDVRAKLSPNIQEGLNMLQTELLLKPENTDAMAYLNLLDRMEAGLVDSAAESADLVAQGDAWVNKALDAAKRRAQSPPVILRSPSSGVVVYQKRDPSYAPFGLLPPPPPPPPPPPGWQGAAK